MATEQEPVHKRARTRSPSYPYLALPEALEKAGTLWRAESRHPASVSVAMQHWGYKAESSTGYSCIAALKKFGLVDEEGVGERREVKLSNLALSILLDETDSPERQGALRAASLNPRIHAELWERYGPDLPSDQSLKRFLVIEKNFNEGSVEEFLAEYRSTIAFAGLTGRAEGSSTASPKTVVAAVQPALLFEDERAVSPPASPWREPAPSARAAAVRREEVQNADRVISPSRSALNEVSRGEQVPHQAHGTIETPAHRNAVAATEPAISMGRGERETSKELLVPLENDQVARVPYPMSEEDFALFIDTLQLWKKRLVRPRSS